MGSNVSGANTFGGNDDIRRPLDMDELESDASEFDWGPGQVPSGLENAPPSEGGMYKGLSPECSPQIGINRR